MVVLAITILIHQLIAAFGVLAVTAAVIAITSIDFQLMFMQGPIDKMLNWKRFKNNKCSKFMVIFLSLVTIVILFLPTLLVLATEALAYKDYYYTDIQQHSQEEYAQDPFSNPNPIILPTTVDNYPPFDDFRMIYFHRVFKTPVYVFMHGGAESIVKTYLYKNLNLPVDTNLGGEWYGILKNLTRSPPEDVQGNNYQDYNNYQRQFEAPIPQRVDAATGVYYTDNNTATYTFGSIGQNSFTIQNCGGQLTSNITDFEDHQILAISNATAGVFCYPQFDASLPIIVQAESSLKPSVVDDYYGVYRTARLEKVKETTSTISVSAINLNDTYLTMAIKKTIHITCHSEILFYDKYNKDILDCSPANLRAISRSSNSYEYNSYKHTEILCRLQLLSQRNPEFDMLQATRRSFGSNSSMNSVYTYSAPTTGNPLGGIAIDLTWFAVYTLKSPIFKLPIGEHLIAHNFKDENCLKDQYTYPKDIESLIKVLDVIQTNDTTDPTLPNLVKIQAALKAKNYYYFSKSTSSTHFAYDVYNKSQWSTVIIVLASVFFLSACLAYKQRKKTLRARISACPIDEIIDDTATLVAGQSKPPKPSVGLKPTKIAFAENTKSAFPILTVDGKIIVLN